MEWTVADDDVFTTFLTSFTDLAGDARTQRLLPPELAATRGGTVRSSCTLTALGVGHQRRGVPYHRLFSSAAPSSPANRPRSSALCPPA